MKIINIKWVVKKLFFTVNKFKNLFAEDFKSTHKLAIDEIADKVARINWTKEKGHFKSDANHCVFLS